MFFCLGANFSEFLQSMFFQAFSYKFILFFLKELLSYLIFAVQQLILVQKLVRDLIVSMLTLSHRKVFIDPTALSLCYNAAYFCIHFWLLFLMLL